MRPLADADGFERVVAHIEGRVPFEPTYYNDAYLDRRIAARMRRRGARSHEEYLRILEVEDRERKLLLDSLTVNVTNFFRNPDMWEVLRGVLRKLTAGPETVRVWSAPCADGREPYSLAMLALDDPRIDARRLEILGTDISEEALSTARTGVYETTRTTDIAAELSPLSAPGAYVEREGDAFTVKRSVRELVEFGRHDLLDDGPRGPFDLVLCRNLLIYIDAGHRGTLFGTIEESTAAGGYLVVGMTETVPADRRRRFEPVDKRCRVYRRA